MEINSITITIEISVAMRSHLDRLKRCSAAENGSKENKLFYSALASQFEDFYNKWAQTSYIKKEKLVESILNA